MAHGSWLQLIMSGVKHRYTFTLLENNSMVQGVLQGQSLEVASVLTLMVLMLGIHCMEGKVVCRLQTHLRLSCSGLDMMHMTDKL